MITRLFKPTVILVGFIAMFCCCTDSGKLGKQQNMASQQPPLNYKLLEHENPGRGLVAVPLEIGKKVYSGEGTFAADQRRVYIGWRLLAKDPDKVAFNVYRTAGDGSNVKVNPSPIGNSTNFVDTALPEGENFTYTVVPVIDGKEGKPSQPYAINYNSQSTTYKSIKLSSDAAVEKVAYADLDGDGELDFVVKTPAGNVDPWYLYWRPSTDTYKLEAYKSDGQHLWTYEMGWAIEQGTWYSPFIVYDFNGDGKAEVVVKSGVSDPDPRDFTGRYTDYVNGQGKGIVITGPEYVTVLDGMTGQPIAQDDWISRDPFFEEIKDHSYNYASRNQLSVAYLDGVNPHIIVLRGTYNLMMAKAYRLNGKKLELAWEWDNRNLREPGNSYWGCGGHTTVVADVDYDGFDEVILGTCALDHDGSPLWTTELGHNDGGYIGDILPERPGLEIYYNIESGRPDGNGMCMVDARTGEIIWGTKFPTNHVHGVGFCSDIDRTQPGREVYGIEVENSERKSTEFALMHNSKGEIISREIMPTEWSVFWDTDNQRELLGEGKVYDYKGPTVHNTEIEGRVMGVADIFGDWREEIITTLPGELRIYTTTILANSRHNSLFQDPIYRSNVAHASNGYYQVPMTTYDIPSRSSK